MFHTLFGVVLFYFGFGFVWGFLGVFFAFVFGGMCNLLNVFKLSFGTGLTTK